MKKEKEQKKKKVKTESTFKTVWTLFKAIGKIFK